jgi:hypothetical protein
MQAGDSISLTLRLGRKPINGLAGAWAVLGVGMALGLYDSAFATLTGLYGRAARGPITGITLIAGFASTVGWPLSAFLDVSVGWFGGRAGDLLAKHFFASRRLQSSI